MGPRATASVPSGALPRFLTLLVAAATVGTFVHYFVWTAPSPAPKLRHGNAELRAMLSPAVLTADTVYLIPGGGSDRGQYPEWSKQRTLAAYEHSANFPNSVFLALSAGSLNAPSGRLDDGRVRFECQSMIEQLVTLGVSRVRIFGDFSSWDTVANALVARQFVEALLALPPPTHASRRVAPLRVEVFVSDFHADRVQAAFEWVLGLEPSVLAEGDASSTSGGTRRARMTVHPVSSASIVWPNKADFQVAQRTCIEDGVLFCLIILFPLHGTGAGGARAQGRGDGARQRPRGHDVERLACLFVAGGAQGSVFYPSLVFVRVLNTLCCRRFLACCRDTATTSTGRT